MPKTIDGETLYTEAEVQLKIEREYVSKADLKSDYVKKSVLQDRLEKIGKKLEAVETERDGLRVELKSAMGADKEKAKLQERVEALEAQINEAEDHKAWSELGLVDDEGAVDVKKARFFEWAWQDHLKSLGDEQPEDTAQAFREWLRAEDGARADAELASMIAAPPAATPQGAPEAAPARAASSPTKPPPPEPPPQRSTMTKAQIYAATQGNPQWVAEMRSLPKEQRDVRFAEVKSQLENAPA